MPSMGYQPLKASGKEIETHSFYLIIVLYMQFLIGLCSLLVCLGHYTNLQDLQNIFSSDKAQESLHIKESVPL